MTNDRSADDKPEVPSELPQGHAVTEVDYTKARHVRFYAEHAGAQITLFDIRLLLSQVDLTETNQKVAARDTLTVLMSPELARMVYDVLGSALETYSTSYGPLRMPPRISAD